MKRSKSFKHSLSELDETMSSPRSFKRARVMSRSDADTIAILNHTTAWLTSLSLAANGTTATTPAHDAHAQAHAITSLLSAAAAAVVAADDAQAHRSAGLGRQTYSHSVPDLSSLASTTAHRRHHSLSHSHSHSLSHRHRPHDLHHPLSWFASAPAPSSATASPFSPSTSPSTSSSSSSLAVDDIDYATDNTSDHEEDSTDYEDVDTDDSELLILEGEKECEKGFELECGRPSAASSIAPASPSTPAPSRWPSPRAFRVHSAVCV